MGTFTGRAVAIGIFAAAGLGPTSLPGATSDLALKFAAPTSQEETIYRPECPSDETSSGGLACHLAGTSGG